MRKNHTLACKVKVKYQLDSPRFLLNTVTTIKVKVTWSVVVNKSNNPHFEELLLLAKKRV